MEVKPQFVKNILGSDDAFKLNGHKNTQYIGVAGTFTLND
jgi:hypothetical protein